MSEQGPLRHLLLDLVGSATDVIDLGVRDPGLTAALEAAGCRTTAVGDDAAALLASGSTRPVLTAPGAWLPSVVLAPATAVVAWLPGVPAALAASTTLAHVRPGGRALLVTTADGGPVVEALTAMGVAVDAEHHEGGRTIVVARHAAAPLAPPLAAAPGGPVGLHPTQDDLVQRQATQLAVLRRRIEDLEHALRATWTERLAADAARPAPAPPGIRAAARTLAKAIARRFGGPR